MVACAEASRPCAPRSTTIRPPEEVRAAALQYVRKVSGFHKPAPHNAQAFEDAVATITAATETLLAGIVVRGATTARSA